MGEDLPHPVAVAVGAGVEVIAVVVFAQGYGAAIELKGGAANAIGVAANGGAEIGASCAVAVNMIVAQDHVRRHPILIRHHKLYKGGTVVGHHSGEKTTGYGVEGGLFSRGQNAELFFHGFFSFHFFDGNGRNYVKTLCCDYTIFRRIFQTFLLTRAENREHSWTKRGIACLAGYGYFFAEKLRLLHFVFCT